MSSLPEILDTRPMTLPRLLDKREAGEPIVMVTAYDFPSARAAERAGVDIVLVGDSAANTVLGYDSTVPVSVDELLMLAAAVRRGLRTPLLVGDLPFGSYEISDAQAIATAQRFVKEAGCDAVKLEGGGVNAERARAIVRAGIPVMGHVGLTPQTATALGGWRAQGRTADRALDLARDALALQEAGCFSIVFEAIPAEVASRHLLAHGDPGHRDRRRGRRSTGRCSCSTTCSGSGRARARASSSATRTCWTRWWTASRRTPPTCARARTRVPSTPTRSTESELTAFRTAVDGLA